LFKIQGNKINDDSEQQGSKKFRGKKSLYLTRTASEFHIRSFINAQRLNFFLKKKKIFIHRYRYYQQ